MFGVSGDDGTYLGTYIQASARVQFTRSNERCLLHHKYKPVWQQIQIPVTAPVQWRGAGGDDDEDEYRRIDGRKICAHGS